MSHVYAFLSGLMLVLSAEGQSVYFISIDADEQEAYQVTLGNKRHVSDAFGHLVLPQLTDSVYSLSVHFASGKYPVHVFRVRVEKADRGFQLKKKSAGQWVLYDWHKMELLPNEQFAPTEVTPTSIRRSDEFARLMAAVLNDSSVLIQPEQALVFFPSGGNDGQPPSALTEKVLPPAAASIKGVVPTVPADAAQKNGHPNSEASKASSFAPISPMDSASLIFLPQLGKVEKLLDNTAAEFRQQLYRDSSASGVDSVMVRIPLENGGINVRSLSSKEAYGEKSAYEDAKQPPLSIRKEKDTVNKKEVIAMVNSDCRSFATDADIDKLRVKMMELSAPADRIETARKIMRTKCFTTRQVRALAELFITDESRYRFFDAAYPFVSDSDRFRDLIDQMSDAYYIARFKALVRY